MLGPIIRRRSEPVTSGWSRSVVGPGPCRACGCWSLRGWSVRGAGATLGLAAGFIGSVNWYFRLKDRRLLWEKLVYVNTNEWAVLQDQPNGFPDGKSFLPGVMYGDDLDIYGPLSIFHTLNRTTTLHGTEALAGWLRRSLQVPDAIRDR